MFYYFSVEQYHCFYGNGNIKILYKMLGPVINRKFKDNMFMKPSMG